MATPPQVTVRLTAEDRGLSSAINSLNEELKSLTKTQLNTAASASAAASAEREMADGMHEAKGAAALLGEETGVKLNRHLRGILAQSQVLGPILKAAFPIAAALGFAEVIAQVTEKVTELISEYFIYTEAQKKAFEAEKEYNTKLLSSQDQLATVLERTQLARLSGAQKVAEQLKHLEESSEATINRLRGQSFAGPGSLGTEETAAAAVKAAQRKELQEAQAREILKEDQALASARATAAVAAANNSLSLARAQLSGEERENESARSHGLITTAQWLKKKSDLIDAEAEAETNSYALALEAANENLAKIQTLPAGRERDTKEIEATQKTADLENKMAEVELKRKDKQSAADDDFAKKVEENAQKIAALRQADLILQGKQTESTDSKINREKELYTLALKARGSTDEEIAEEIAGWETRQRAASAFAETQKKMGAEMAAFDAQRKAAADIVETQGPFSAAARANVEAMRAEIALLIQQLEMLKETAITGNEEQAKAISELQAKITGMQKAVDQTDTFSKMKTDLSKGLAGDLTSFFTKGIAGAHSFGEAMKGLAASVLQTVQQIIAQLIQMQIQAAMLKMLGAAAGGAGGVGGAGGSVGPSGGFPGMATGGFVSGPGGPKEDRVPAMLSAGEFVLTAESVQALGAANLEAMNKGLSSTNVNQGAPMHFATGGLAGAELTHTSEINMGVGLDDGLILRHIASKKGAKILLTHLSNNSKAANRALSRAE